MIAEKMMKLLQRELDAREGTKTPRSEQLNRGFPGHYKLFFCSLLLLLIFLLLIIFSEIQFVLIDLLLSKGHRVKNSIPISFLKFINWFLVLYFQIVCFGRRRNANTSVTIWIRLLPSLLATE